jgi:hypothetical protein
MAAADGRSENFQLRMSTGELQMLRAIAEADGLTASDVIRQMIRRAFMERWPPKVKLKPMR